MGNISTPRTAGLDVFTEDENGRKPEIHPSPSAHTGRLAAAGPRYIVRSRQSLALAGMDDSAMCDLTCIPIELIPVHCMIHDSNMSILHMSDMCSYIAT